MRRDHPRRVDTLIPDAYNNSPDASTNSPDALILDASPPVSINSLPSCVFCRAFLTASMTPRFSPREPLVFKLQPALSDQVGNMTSTFLCRCSVLSLGSSVSGAGC